MASEPTLSTLALLAAEAESTSLSNDPESSADALDHQQRQNQRTFVRTLHKVIDESDLIILVLDARDPEGCRSRLVEEEVLRREAEGKRLVFVLNKIGTLLLRALVHFSNVHIRLDPKRECTGMAQISPPYRAHPTLSIHQYLPESRCCTGGQHGPRTPKTSQILPGVFVSLGNHWHRWISERWQEQLNQRAQEKQGRLPYFEPV